MGPNSSRASSKSAQPNTAAANTTSKGVRDPGLDLLLKYAIVSSNRCVDPLAKEIFYRKCHENHNKKSYSALVKVLQNYDRDRFKGLTTVEAEFMHQFVDKYDEEAVLGCEDGKRRRSEYVERAKRCWGGAAGRGGHDDREGWGGSEGRKVE